MDGRNHIGVMYDRALPPQGLAEFARAAEAAGAEELWVVEDLGYSGAVSAATAALAATSRIRVGIGIAPARSAIPRCSRWSSPPWPGCSRAG